MPTNPPIPEVWVSLTTYFPYLEDGYFLSNYGRLYSSLNREYYPNENFTTDKYISVYLKHKTGEVQQVYMHRLVLYIWGYRPDHLDFSVNHIDGKKYHNWIWNLEWVTHLENMQHAFQTGLAKSGEDVPYSTITNEQAHLIAKKLSEGYRPKEIEALLQYDIPNARIKQIAVDMANNQSWKNITSQYNMENCYKNKPRESRFPFTDEQIHVICKLFEKHGKRLDVNFILDSLGYEYDQTDPKEKDRIGAHLSLIRNKRTKKEICDLYNY